MRRRSNPFGIDPQAIVTVGALILGFRLLTDTLAKKLLTDTLAKKAEEPVKGVET